MVNLTKQIQIRLSEKEHRILKQNIEQAKRNDSYVWQFVNPSQNTVIRLALNEYFKNHAKDFQMKGSVEDE